MQHDTFELTGRWFIARVITHGIGKFRGMVSVRVDGFMDGILDEHLPFAAIMRPVMRGFTPGVGFFGLPRIGSEVVVIFDHVITSPVIVGEIPNNSQAPVMNNDDEFGYVDPFGNRIYTTDDGAVIVDHNSGAKSKVGPDSRVEFTADFVTIRATDNLAVLGNGTWTGNLDMTGTFTLGGVVQNTHVHNVPTIGDSDGPHNLTV